MDKDKLTTLLGSIVAVLIGAGIVTQASGNTVLQVGGVLVGVAIFFWGFFTNKS